MPVRINSKRHGRISFSYDLFKVADFREVFDLKTKSSKVIAIQCFDPFLTELFDGESLKASKRNGQLFETFPLMFKSRVYISVQCDIDI